MNFIVLGVNHTTAGIETRERLCVSKDELEVFLPLLQKEFFNECFILTTCNRTEIYGMLRSAGTPAEDIIRYFLQLKSEPGVSPNCFFVHRAQEAIRHLFEVASGIDSLVTGDVQIVGQLKEAYRIASEMNMTGPLLGRLAMSACHVAKRSRSETTISEGTVSVSYAAVELLQDHLRNLTDKSALLIGAGKTGRLTAKHLTQHFIRDIQIANRTQSRAEELASEIGATAVPMEAIASALLTADIVITSVETPVPLFGKNLFETAMLQRRGRPLYIVDIGMPRNVAAEVTEIPGIHLWDMTALAAVVERNRHQRRAEVVKVRAIVNEEWDAFNTWYYAKRVGPTIQDLNAHFEDIRSGELAKYAHRFGDSEKELVEMLTRRIVNKLLHKPMVNLKSAPSADEQMQHEVAIRTLFGLTENSRN